MSATEAEKLDGIQDHVIGRSDLDRSFEQLRAGADDPRAGVFGPDSMMWRMLEPLPVLPLMEVQAGLLEFATPKIYFGTENSVTRSGDFSSRFARSYDAFMDWFAGDIDTATRTARRIHGYHTRVGGHAPSALGQVAEGQYYRASEQELMVFTLGTQVVPIKQIYEMLVAPLTAAETTRYYDECKRLAMLFGIDTAVMPATWRDFETSYEGSLTTELDVCGDGMNRLGLLLDPSPLPLKTRTLVKVLMTLQFNMLPESLRKQYEPLVPLAKARPRTTAAIRLTLKTLLRILPRDVVSAPRIVAARERCGSPARSLARRVARTLPHPYGERMPTLNTPASIDADPKHSKALTERPVP